VDLDILCIECVNSLVADLHNMRVSFEIESPEYKLFDFDGNRTTHSVQPNRHDIVVGCKFYLNLIQLAVNIQQTYGHYLSSVHKITYDHATNNLHGV
jgi:hypothetical protein